VVATDKETGKIVWDKNPRASPTSSSPPRRSRSSSIIIGASGGDRGLRDWIASLDAKTGDLRWKSFAVPAPGEPGSETWKDKNNAWQTGGGAFYVTGSYDPELDISYWGSGNPVPGYDSAYRPGDNLYTNSLLAIDGATGKFKWHFQYTPNDNRDYDETGTHILIDTKVNGEDRRIVSHAGRNGTTLTFDRVNGHHQGGAARRQGHLTKGIDPKTGRVDYDPTRDVQIYAEPANVNDDKVTRNVCPDNAGGTNYWPASYSQKSKMVYIPELEGCADITPDYSAHVKGKFAGGSYVNPGRITSGIVMVDPATNEVKRKSTEISELCRRAEHRRRPGGDRADRRHHPGARRSDARALAHNVGTGFNAHR
jgi:alcohol dehydrogenase (cytochrome c)